MPITFRYDSDRARAAVLWLLNRHGGRMSVLKLVKLAFLADRMHLARYGRPIFGGVYVAMEHGPVPSDLYDEIKENTEGFVRQGNDVVAQDQTDEDCLSESDLEVLERVDREHGKKDPWQLRDMTHGFEAWKQCYSGGAHSYPLPYERFFLDLQPEEQEMLEIIREDQALRDVLD